jgi:heme/copper-type cytochrome/quinol oxidase subunit 2
MPIKVEVVSTEKYINWIENLLNEIEEDL